MATRYSSTRISFIISIWSEDGLAWRGYIESADLTRHYFTTLTQLDTLLKKQGWQDATSAGSHKIFSSSL